MTQTLQLITLAIVTTQVCAQSVPTNRTTGAASQAFENRLTWTHFAGGSKHQSHALIPDTLAPLTMPAWIASGDGSTTYIPRPQSGIVVDEDRIFALATDPSVPGSAFAVSYDRLSGSFNWATIIPPAILDSWSTPAIDIQHQQLIVASGGLITAIDTLTGTINWSTNIGGIVVNASPIVTDDLGHRDRAFITNYSFGGSSDAKLTCINTDPFNPSFNPYQPGEIVWQASLMGDSSGNTPAYSSGMVYVSSASSPGSLAGQVHAFDARSLTLPTPTWTYTNTLNTGFFSGVSLDRGHLYASSYSFTGLQHSANTVKINRHTGAQVWSVETNRTDATPIVLPNGDVIISSGIATGAFDFLPFYGSLPSIQYISDEGNTASTLWDSALSTHDDTNSNGFWEFGEPFLSIGGWTHQPIALSINSIPMLLVGTLAQTTPGTQFDHNTDLRLIDLTKLPTDPGFIVDQFNGAGSTPAIAGDWIYSAGQTGIHAFAPPAPSPNELVQRFTRGQLTINQLLNQLRR